MKKSNLITREQTIIIEASQKHSHSNTNSDYETTLTKGVEINNGDTVQVSGAYIDTTKIDPSRIHIENDVPINWQNGLYLINQEFVNTAPSRKGEARETLNDLKPYTLCEYTVSGGENLVHYKTANLITNLVHGLVWGDVKFFVQYKSPDNQLIKKVIYIPQQNASIFDGRITFTYDLDFVGQSSYTPVAINPATGKVDNDWQPYQGTVIYHPIVDGSITTEPVTSGLFHTVQNKGDFILPAGDYEPDHLAKILTDNFTYINTTALTTTPIPHYGKFIIGGDITDSNYAVTINTSSFTLTTKLFEELPYPAASREFYQGWTVEARYAINADDPPSYITYPNTITGAGTGGNEINCEDAWPVLPDPGGVYGSGGGIRIYLYPPEDYNEEGSAFLQTTQNYNSTGPDGNPSFSFVDCSSKAPSNILTFSTVDKYFMFGSNQVEILYDSDLKRFRFNYLHYPLTADSTNAPALVAQISWVSDGAANPTYTRSYDDGSINQIVSSYAGVFFTLLEPRSLFENILGFDYTNESIIVPIDDLSSITNTFSGGQIINNNGITPVTYTEVHTPFMTLSYGRNITRQNVTIGDVVGIQSDYTQPIPFDYGNGHQPESSNENGRIAIEEDQVLSIIASTIGEQVGVQDSGFYIVEIEIGMQYNTNIGSISQSSSQSSFSRHIRTVVDRYYSANSYTSTAGNNINYIHYGTSTQITSVKVRIYNSDGSIISHIGNDNTIFLKVIKNNTIDISEDVATKEKK